MSNTSLDARRDASPESKQQVLFDSLRKFYTQGDHLQQLTRVLNEHSSTTEATGNEETESTGNVGISLRILDWLVTNYSKKNNIVYFVTDPSGMHSAFNMFMEYKSQLKAYSKKFFDPFCRRERLDFTDVDGTVFRTTVGQLNFFRWAITHGVVDYGTRYAVDIEADMMDSIKHRISAPAKIGPAKGAPAKGAPAKGAPENAAPIPFQKTGKPRRKELSKAAIKSCTKTMLHVTVRFT